MSISAINPYYNKKRENVDALINMSDKDIQTLAYHRTLNKFNQKKSNTVTNAMFYSAPLAAGLGVAILGSGKPSKIFSTELTGLAARASRGLKITALWVATLGALDLMSFAKSKVTEKSETVQKFERKHPLLSIGTLLALGFGVISLVNRGAYKIGKLKAPDFMKNAAKKTGEFLNTNKYIEKAKNTLISVKDNTHPVIKDIAKTVLDWSPAALLLGGFFHSLTSSNKIAGEFSKNYFELKNKQSQVAQKRVLELSLQNDFLMQNPDNIEAIELINNPITGIKA